MGSEGSRSGWCSENLIQECRFAPHSRETNLLAEMQQLRGLAVQRARTWELTRASPSLVPGSIRLPDPTRTPERKRILCFRPISASGMGPPASRKPGPPAVLRLA